MRGLPAGRCQVGPLRPEERDSRGGAPADARGQVRAPRWREPGELKCASVCRVWRWFCVVLVACGCAGASSAPSGRAPMQSGDERYDALWTRFLGEYLRLNPVEATRLGMHDHDGEWPDLSADGDRARRSLYDSTRNELDAIPAAELSAEHRLDAAIL